MEIILFYSFKGSGWQQNHFLKGERKFNVMIFLTLVLFILICLGPYFVSHLGQIYAGDLSEGTNVVNKVLQSILSDKIFLLIAVLTTIGGLAKAVSNNSATRVVSNVLITWLPSLICILVIIQVIQPPLIVVNLLGGNFFFAWMMYLLIILTVMITLAGIQQVFAGLRTKVARE